jgi:hypothetical protein
MEDPDWKDTLQIVYNNQILWSKDTDCDSNHPVVKKSDKEPEQVQEDLAFLHEVGLIGPHHVGVKKEISRPNKSALAGLSDHAEKVGTHLGLTPKGFEVAHNRVQTEASQEINRTLVILTWILAGTATIQALTAIVGLQGFDQKFISVVSIVLLLTIYIGIKQTAD